MRSPLKNKHLKNASSLAKRNSEAAEIQGSSILDVMWVDKADSILTNKGVACLGVTAACNCSDVTAFR